MTQEKEFMNTEKILLVDDERAIRLAVRTALTREGMHVTEGSRWKYEALEFLKTTVPSGDPGCDDGTCQRL